MYTATIFENAVLWSIIGVAVLGLLYAVLLTRQILRADKGDAKMIRSGAQFA